MHLGVASCTQYLDEDNLDLLDGTTFVFLASDDAATKPAIMDWLETHDVPFIDVGMGIEEIDGHLSGLLRVTTSLLGRRDTARRRIPRPAPERDAYGSNIQTADLNALNAILAVVRWTPSICNWSLPCRRTTGSATAASAATRRRKSIRTRIGTAACWPPMTPASGNRGEQPASAGS